MLSPILERRGLFSFKGNFEKYQTSLEKEVGRKSRSSLTTGGFDRYG
jgi:hypothetical protein